MKKLFLLISILVLLFFNGCNKEKNENVIFNNISEEIINNQVDYGCHWNPKLQPSRLISSQTILPIVNDDKEKILRIEYLNGRKLFTDQVAGTGSMFPTIPDYSIIVYVIPEKDEIKIGDIITIKATSRLKHLLNIKSGLVHRLVGIEVKDGIVYYITKGDNNAVVDSQKWRFEDIDGKVVGVFY